ncbi:MAG: hypothetical protein M3535_11510, partial [Actinomycetota bacterium]|nr:hypothetical protein [Actinomycetota bacterium]
PTSIHRRAWVFMDHLPWTALHRPPHVDGAPEAGYPGPMTDPDESSDEPNDVPSEEPSEEPSDGPDPDEPNDGPDPDEPSDESKDGPKDVPSEERLEQVQEDIDHARKTAEDADVLIDPDEPRFYESGDTEEEDDQTTAPPG